MIQRKREIADTTQKGKIRYHLYKGVISRYKDAMEAGFYLEAITLMESLITDRLESALNYYGLCPQCLDFQPLGVVLKPFYNQGIISDDLYAEIDDWKKARNQALHEMAKIEKGKSPVFSQRYASQQIIARRGYELFKKLKEELR